jgi:hypothetical protein
MTEVDNLTKLLLHCIKELGNESRCTITANTIWKKLTKDLDPPEIRASTIHELSQALEVRASISYCCIGKPMQNGHRFIFVRFSDSSCFLLNSYLNFYSLRNWCYGIFYDHEKEMGSAGIHLMGRPNKAAESLVTYLKHPSLNTTSTSLAVFQFISLESSDSFLQGDIYMFSRPLIFTDEKCG